MDDTRAQPDPDGAEERWTDEREIHIEAAPQEVWAAWAEPEHVRRWFSDEAHGDLAAGGELVHVFTGHGEHRYRVLEVEPPQKLVLASDLGAGAFRQEVVIRRKAGTTILRLVHSGFGGVDPDSEPTQGIDSGWTMALATLKHYVEDHFGREKHTLTAFLPARFDYSTLLRHFYMTDTGLGEWITDGAAGIAPFGPVSLLLRSGTTVTGDVLVRTAHEISISWAEVAGLLEFKAFGTGPDSRFLGIRALSWGTGLSEELRTELGEAVERLAAAQRGVPA